MVKQSQIKNILLNISAISSQVLAKNYKKNIGPTKKHFSSFLKNPNNLTFFITPTTVEEVNDLISDLKAIKSIGPSSLTTKIRKKLNDIIEAPLAESVIKSFQSGVFADIFKIAKVILIFKTESRVLCNSYRPISLLSNSKLIGKLMHKRVYSLEQQNCFYNAQFVFRLSLSTNNALMSISEHMQSYLDQNKFCAGVFVDLNIVIRNGKIVCKHRPNRPFFLYKLSSKNY